MEINRKRKKKRQQGSYNSLPSHTHAKEAMFAATHFNCSLYGWSFSKTRAEETTALYHKDRNCNELAYMRVLQHFRLRLCSAAVDSIVLQAIRIQRKMTISVALI